MAQVYTRIANPFMPNQTPDKTNSPTPFYAPGEIGCAFNDQNTGGSYLRVLLDSGATSATPIGAVAAGQLAFWKNRAAAIVTNDARFADTGSTGAVNRVAGIFQTAVTAGGGATGTDGQPLQYVCDLVIQKLAYPVLVSGAPSALGVAGVANPTTANANVTPLASATTAPTSQVIGVFATTVMVTNNLCPCDVNIGFVD